MPAVITLCVDIIPILRKTVTDEQCAMKPSSLEYRINFKDASPLNRVPSSMRCLPGRVIGSCRKIISIFTALW